MQSGILVEKPPFCVLEPPFGGLGATYEVYRRLLTTTEPSYLYNLISIQPLRSTRSSDIVSLARLPSYSSLEVNSRSFRHASPRLWNELPKELRQPVDDESLSLSSHFSLTGLSSSPSSSPLSLDLFSTPDSKHSFSTTIFLTFSNGFHGFL